MQSNGSGRRLPGDVADEGNQESTGRLRQGEMVVQADVKPDGVDLYRGRLPRSRLPFLRV